ncbi:MAG TPA: alpha/beta hydrolase [Opitutaceae bacterium]
MKFRFWVSALLLAFSSLGISAARADQPAPSQPIHLWPGKPPGDEKKSFPAEADTTTQKDDLIAGRRLIRLGNVSDPEMTVYAPEAAKRTGAAVLVCPGGGYNILAYDLEGSEVCEWLNSLGVTAVLLKYRVPTRAMARYMAPLQDAQRAMRLLRSQAKTLEIDPQRIGVLGFSAGGNLAVMLSTTQKRVYEKLDAADKESCRPDFSILIYPAYLVDKDKNDNLVPELHVTKETPSTFIVMTEDDPVRVEGVLHYYKALRDADVPAEMHLYAKGGHGYGLRRTDKPVTTWPERAADWLKASGFLSEAK